MLNLEDLHIGFYNRYRDNICNLYYEANEAKYKGEIILKIVLCIFVNLKNLRQSSKSGYKIGEETVRHGLLGGGYNQGIL